MDWLSPDLRVRAYRNLAAMAMERHDSLAACAYLLVALSHRRP
jgi:hypothetical protein